MRTALRATAILYSGVVPERPYVLQQPNLLLFTIHYSLFTSGSPLNLRFTKAMLAIPVFAITTTHSNSYKSLA